MLKAKYITESEINWIKFTKNCAVEQWGPWAPDFLKTKMTNLKEQHGTLGLSFRGIQNLLSSQYKRNFKEDDLNRSSKNGINGINGIIY